MNEFGAAAGPDRPSGAAMSEFGESIVTEIIATNASSAAARPRSCSSDIAFRLSRSRSPRLFRLTILQALFAFCGALIVASAPRTSACGTRMLLSSAAVSPARPPPRCSGAPASRDPDRSAPGLSARIALRKARRRAARSAAQDRACRGDLARHHARRRSLGCALRLCRRQKSRATSTASCTTALVNAVRARDSASVADYHRQGVGDRERRGAAASSAVERRGNLGAAGGARQRPQYRPSPHARASSAESSAQCHSITLGFDVEPVGRRAFDFPALDLLAEAIERRAWPICRSFRSAATMRANLMVYRDMTDPWLQRLRKAPEERCSA